MSKEIWLSVEEVCELTGEIKETVRRKCKREEYVSTFEKNGKFKTYTISLDSLPETIKNKYYGVHVAKTHSKFYNQAPVWAKKQAQKYTTLIELTQGMKHKEIVEFLKSWNRMHPGKKSSYSALCRAKIKYENFGEDALLSQKGLNKNKYSIKPEYYEYYKNLYLTPSAPSAASCWAETLSYALRTAKERVPYFPCEKTFDRFLKKEMSAEAIKYARTHHEMVFAKDLSNIRANEYWSIESYQFKFPIKVKHTSYYPWITVVKDVKTSKWLSYFLYPDIINTDHITQAVYYAVTKYGIPKKIYLKTTKFSNYINSVGKILNADINCYDAGLRTTMFCTKTDITDNIPQSLNIKSISKDLKLVENMQSEMNLYEFKALLDDYIDKIINKKVFRTKLLSGKTPDDLWNEEYVKPILPSKDALVHLCLRNKNPVQVIRNGIFDSFTGKTYWGDWMYYYIGGNVFIRRDIYSDDKAYAYRADGRGIGYVEVLPSVPALAKDEKGRALLKKEMERKRKMLKIAKSYLPTREITLAEKVENYIQTCEQNIPEANPVLILKRTKLDGVMELERQRRRDRQTADNLLSELAKC